MTDHYDVIVRQGAVYVDGHHAGMIQETADGIYRFFYLPRYVENSKNLLPVSLTLPIRSEPYEAKTLFPFFDGLIPEGWLLNLASHNWKLDQKDRMGLLIEACEDCIGNVSIKQVKI